jgi:subtilisin family serine protease
MAKYQITPMEKMSCMLTTCFLLSIVLSTNAEFTKKTYIIQMDHSAKPDIFSNHLEWYSSKVKSVLSKSVESDIDNNEEERIIYSYNTAFHGMAAKLSQEEVKKLESEAGVVAIFPETKYELHTTRSPYFLGLEPFQSSNNSLSEKLVNHDVIVGVLDTGVWPESESFNDAGMKPVPSHWKGVCETGRGFRNNHCNKKIVGARIFYHGYEAATGKIDEQADYKSPRDQDGHGTHTAATVAGSPVRGANLLGYAYGTARGMAPGITRISHFFITQVIDQENLFIHYKFI